MSDIKGDKPHVEESQIRSPISRFNRWLRNFGRRQEEVAANQEQIVGPITNTFGLLDEKLREKESEITPPEVKSRGVLAILDTNEKTTAGFYEAIQERNLNGYIVGVGVGNVFSLLNCFKEDNPPKGMVLVDIDPRVVTVGRVIVDSLRQAETSSDFIDNFFRLPRRN